LETAALRGSPESWSLYLALARLDRLQQERLAQLTDPDLNRAYRQQIEAFERRLDQALAAINAQKTRLAVPLMALKRTEAGPGARRRILEDIRAEDTDNNELLVALAYYSAMADDWQAALAYAREFLSLPGRTSAGKLSVGLFEPEILQMLGQTTPARKRLNAYRAGVPDPWYRSLSESLLDPARQEALTARAEENPAYLLTGHTALGLWAEGRKDVPGAIRHYREALGSYMDHRIEYDFAMARVKRLRRAEE
jgi:hypothetical protein